MRVLVTRPIREAQSWLQALKSAGLDPVALPLIEIAPLDDLRPVTEVWRQIIRYRAVMFVSANAVDFFFAAQPQSTSSKLPSFQAGNLPVRAWATGPGTASALARRGVPSGLIDSPSPDALQFDSESLWAEVSGQVSAGTPVLIVRGDEAVGQAVGLVNRLANRPARAGANGAGRDWLAQHVEQAGGSVDFLVVYRRQVPVFSQAQCERVRTASYDGSVWLFSSSQAVDNLTSNFPNLTWAQARAVATHPRIAQTARSHGFGVVCESRPTLSDVIASIESLA